MRKIIFLFIFLGYFAIFNMAMSFAELYENQEYGFEIDYPTGWHIYDDLIVYESIPEYDEGSANFVEFYDEDEWWNHSIDIGFIKNDFIARNYEGQEYLDELEAELVRICQIVTLEFNGYTCTNNKIIESKIITISDHDAYQVTESWVETYDDQSTFEVIGISIDIPVGSNVWTIDSYSLETEYPLVKNQIQESINTFRLTNGGIEPDLDYEYSERIENIQNYGVISIIIGVVGGVGYTLLHRHNSKKITRELSIIDQDIKTPNILVKKINWKGRNKDYQVLFYEDKLLFAKLGKNTINFDDASVLEILRENNDNFCIFYHEVDKIEVLDTTYKKDGIAVAKLRIDSRDHAGTWDILSKNDLEECVKIIDKINK